MHDRILPMMRVKNENKKNEEKNIQYTRIHMIFIYYISFSCLIFCLVGIQTHERRRIKLCKVLSNVVLHRKIIKKKVLEVCQDSEGEKENAESNSSCRECLSSPWM